MPEDTKEKHTPAPWAYNTDSPNLVCALKERGERLAPVFVDVAETFGNGEAAGPTAEGNARRIIACVNFCEGVSTADLEESLQRRDTLANEDEAIVALLNEVGEERNDLRDENERLRERVAELEGALLRIRDWIEEKGYRGEGEQTVFDESWHPEAHLDLRSMLVKDARAVFAALSSDENASREAEVSHE